MLDEQDNVLPQTEFTFCQRIGPPIPILKILSRAVTDIWKYAVGPQKKKL